MGADEVVFAGLPRPFLVGGELDVEASGYDVGKEFVGRAALFPGDHLGGSLLVVFRGQDAEGVGEGLNVGGFDASEDVGRRGVVGAGLEFG